MALILQRETAQRFFASHGSAEMGPISVFLQSAYGKVHGAPLSSSAFYPIPAVSSAIVVAERLPEVFRFKDAAKYAIRRIFTKRRKQIGGIVRNESENVKIWLAENVTPAARPDEISILQWQKLNNFF
jgi:16S rRNA (adenine1518-N6/adenine1519-N6)-dimethyltransferase